MLEATESVVSKLVLKEIEMNDSMAKFGASLIKNGENILTHCNTGSLATPGKGNFKSSCLYIHYEKVLLSVSSKRHIFKEKTFTSTSTKLVLSSKVAGSQLTNWKEKEFLTLSFATIWLLR
jgi:methylthioribose-1-phosphate isomerase